MYKKGLNAAIEGQAKAREKLEKLLPKKNGSMNKLSIGYGRIVM